MPSLLNPAPQALANGPYNKQSTPESDQSKGTGEYKLVLNDSFTEENKPDGNSNNTK